MIRKALTGTLLLFSSIAALSQMAPKPGPEVKKLDYFIGNWTTEGTVPEGPWGAGGKFSWADTMEWMNGNFFVINHADFKMPPELGGDGKEVSMYGYDTTQNLYTYEAFNSQGQHESSRGTFKDDTWTWTGENNYDGQDVKHRMTMKVLSPTSYSVKFEVSMDGTTWTTFMEGKSTKK